MKEVGKELARVPERVGELSGPQATVAMDGSARAEFHVADLIRLAESGKLNVETLERLVALQERGAARNARDAFNQALSSFQRECPQIGRTARAEFAGRAGVKMGYSYAPLDEIARVIREPLRNNGLSYTWDMEVQAAGFLKSTCHVRHVEGHSESASFVVPTETNAAMSPQQKYGAASTYAQRRSLLQALGITTADEDTDGAEVNPDPVTDAQVADLEALAKEVGVNKGKFLEWLGASSFGEIRGADFKRAVAALEKKRAAV